MDVPRPECVKPRVECVQTPLHGHWINWRSSLQGCTYYTIQQIAKLLIWNVQRMRVRRSKTIACISQHLHPRSNGKGFGTFFAMMSNRKRL